MSNEEYKVNGSTSLGTFSVGDSQIDTGISNESLIVSALEKSNNYEKVNKNLEEVLETDSQEDYPESIMLDEENSNLEIIEPEVDFSVYEKLVDMSQVLSTAIDAMKTNIYGFGYELVCQLDIKNEKGVKVYRDTGEPIPDKVLLEIDDEKNIIESFIESLNLDYSFEELLKLIGDNQERFGNAFCEWEKDFDGNYVGLDLVPAKTVRLTKKEQIPIEVAQFVLDKRNFSYLEKKRTKRFRRFVQQVNAKKLFFKEFGDPRLMNAKTGKYIKDQQGNYLLDTDYKNLVEKSGTSALPKGFVRAREIMHFKVYHPSGPYGKPRYLPSTPKILGSRAADLVNYNLLENNTIPPLVIIIEGYQDDTIVKKVEEYIKNKLRGKDSFNKILILQAEAQITGGAGPNIEALKPNIRIEPLTQMLTRDGMFLEYTNKSAEDIISSFRLTNMYVGMTKDINRATAQVAKEQVEEQVFSPARQEFNFIMNNKVLTSLKIKYWKFKLRNGKLEDNDLKSKIVEAFVRQGILLPSDGRRIASKILDEVFEEVTDEFMNKPKDIAVAEIRSLGGIMSTINEIDPELTTDLGREFDDSFSDDKENLEIGLESDYNDRSNIVAIAKKIYEAKTKNKIKNSIFIKI